MKAANAPILVGVDGSARSLRAVEWATHEAGRRDRPLNLLYVNTWSGYRTTAWPDWGPVYEEGEPVGGRHALAAANETAQTIDPAVVVSGEIVNGSPARVILDLARDAAMVVVGRRGVGGFAGMLLGSTASQVAIHARCPVAVVPEGAAEPAAHGPGVVLGVDGSERCRPAVEFAFEEASGRHVPLTAVRAWHGQADDPAIVEPFPPLPEDHAAEQRRVVSEALSGWGEKYPDVSVKHVVVHGRAARAVLDAADGAQLIVVGSRGGGGFAALLLGSVGDTVLRHASCPVVVVPEPRTTE